MPGIEKLILLASVCRTCVGPMQPIVGSYRYEPLAEDILVQRIDPTTTASPIRADVSLKGEMKLSLSNMSAFGTVLPADHRSW
jgi:hypothetical protein